MKSLSSNKNQNSTFWFARYFNKILKIFYGQTFLRLLFLKSLFCTHTSVYCSLLMHVSQAHPICFEFQIFFLRKKKLISKIGAIVLHSKTWDKKCFGVFWQFGVPVKSASSLRTKLLSWAFYLVRENWYWWWAREISIFFVLFCRRAVQFVLRGRAIPAASRSIWNNKSQVHTTRGCSQKETSAFLIPARCNNKTGSFSPSNAFHLFKIRFLIFLFPNSIYSRKFKAFWWII